MNQLWRPCSLAATNNDKNKTNKNQDRSSCPAQGRRQANTCTLHSAIFHTKKLRKLNGSFARVKPVGFDLVIISQSWGTDGVVPAWDDSEKQSRKICVRSDRKVDHNTDGRLVTCRGEMISPGTWKSDMLSTIISRKRKSERRKE